MSNKGQMKNKQDKKRCAILVVGMHRSGTSAVAESLAGLGVDFGDNLIPAAADNLGGFWEDAGVVALNDQLLALANMRWHSAREFNWKALAGDNGRAFKAKAEELIKSQFSRSELWGLKDPRLCRLLPFWLEVLKSLSIEVKCISVIRNPFSVSQSLMRRNYFSIDQACWLWLRHVVESYRAMASVSDVTTIEYDQFIESPAVALHSIQEDMGLICKTEVDTSLIKKDQRNHSGRLDIDSQSYGIVAVAKNLYSVMAGEGFRKLATNPAFKKAIDAAEAEMQTMEKSAHYIDLIADTLDTKKSSEIKWMEERIQALDESKKEQELLLRDKDNYIVKLGSDHNERESWLAEKNEQLNSILAEQTKLLVEKDEYIINLTGENQERINWLERQIEQLDALLVKQASAMEVKDDLIASLRADRSIFYFFIQMYKKISHTLYRILYRLFKIPFLPQSLKSKIVSGVRHYRDRVFTKYNGDSYRKSLQFLARERSTTLLSKASKSERSNKQELVPFLDISVVTFNSEKWVERFFDSLESQSYPLSKVSLHFVDHGSSDNTVEEISQFITKLEKKFARAVIHERPNLGFGAGHNYVLEQSEQEFTLVTNIDIEFEVDTISSLVSTAVDDGEKVASWECRQKPYEHPKYYDPVTLETAWSSHACILLRNSAYREVGGYEKKIFMYGEDVELSYRFRDAGYSIKYVPKAVVWHYTYEYENQVKPIQYFGSTLANAYIRMRYGNWRNILEIIPIYGFLLCRGGEFHGARKGLLKNVLKIINNSPYFILKRKKSKLNFPFRGWDYEMQRDGAFYNNVKLPEAPPLVSVITRTYAGRERWLVEAVASVLNQTYPRVELIVVEDGGDSQKDLIEEVAGTFSQGKILRYAAQPKNGRSYNGNAGLAMATGEYMMFLDDDDLLFPDHIEVLVNELLGNPDVSAAYALSWEVDTDTCEKNLSNEAHYKEMSYKTPGVFRQEFSVDAIRHHNFIPIQAIIFKRELYDFHGGFDVEMDQLEDWNLWVRYSSNADFLHVPKTTSLFRTPYDLEERARRHSLLNAAYETAIEKQNKFLKEVKDSRLQGCESR